MDIEKDGDIDRCRVPSGVQVPDKDMGFGVWEMGDGRLEMGFSQVTELIRT